MIEILAGSPWLTHGAVLTLGILIGVALDLICVYRPERD